MSRWMMDLECKCCRPRQVWKVKGYHSQSPSPSLVFDELTSRHIAAIWFSSNLLFSITSVSAPPSIYSMTTQSSEPRTRNASRKLTTFGCWDSRITMISFTISSLRGCWDKSICLTATFLPFSSVLATKTIPDALRSLVKMVPSGDTGDTAATHPWPTFRIFEYSWDGSFALTTDRSFSIICTSFIVLILFSIVGPGLRVTFSLSNLAIAGRVDSKSWCCGLSTFSFSFWAEVY